MMAWNMNDPIVSEGKGCGCRVDGRRPVGREEMCCVCLEGQVQGNADRETRGKVGERCLRGIIIYFFR